MAKQRKGTRVSKPKAGNGPEWQWRTFPVLAACVFGALLASFLDRPDTAFAIGVRVMLVLAAAFCVAHTFIMSVVVPRRMRVRAAVGGGSDIADESELEEELVFETEEKS